MGGYEVLIWLTNLGALGQGDCCCAVKGNHKDMDMDMEDSVCVCVCVCERERERGLYILVLCCLSFLGLCFKLHLV